MVDGASLYKHIFLRKVRYIFLDNIIQETSTMIKFIYVLGNEPKGRLFEIAAY